MAVPPTPLPPQHPALLLARRATPTFTRRRPTTAWRGRLTNRRRRQRKAINRRRRRGSIGIRAWPWSSVRCTWPAITTAVRSTCSNSSSNSSWKSQQKCWHTIIILVSQMIGNYVYLTAVLWIRIHFFTDPDPEYDVGDRYGSGSGSNTDPGLWWPKIAKKLQLKFFFYFFDQKLQFTYP